MDFSKGRGNAIKDIANKSLPTVDITGKIINVSIQDIIENPDNENIFNMEEIDFLAQSISEDGFQGAIEVIESEIKGKYEIISGHRRYRAMKSLQEDAIPCIVLEIDNPVEKAKALLGSNIRNRKLSPIDMSRAINYYEKNVLEAQEFKGDKRKAVASFFNISRSQVHKYKVLDRLIEELKQMIEKNMIPYSSLSKVAVCEENIQRSIYFDLNNEIAGNGIFNNSEMEYEALTRKETDDIINAKLNPISEHEDTEADAKVDTEQEDTEADVEVDTEQEDTEADAKVDTEQEDTEADVEVDTEQEDTEADAEVDTEQEDTEADAKEDTYEYKERLLRRISLFRLSLYENVNKKELIKNIEKLINDINIEKELLMND